MSFLLVAQRALTVPGWVKNALWRAAKATPSLDLPFADSKSLVDAITGRQLISFARASSGTYVDSAGVLRTATTNLLLRSEEFNDGYWSKVSCTIAANTATAPNGTVTADQQTHTGGGPRLTIAVSGATASAVYTLSFYAKRETSSFASVSIYDNTTTGNRFWFNLLTEQVGTKTNIATGYPSSSHSIQSVGDNWYRCVVTFTNTSSSSITVDGISVVGNADGALTPSTTGLTGLVWGAQLEQSSTVGEYIPTGSTINSAPRFDHNPLTGESLGLLVEEQRTNSIRNNTMVGAVAGTPGTVPTNWGDAPTSNGLNRQIVGIGTQNGITYIDIRYSGTTTATAPLPLQPELGAVTVAATGQSWTASSWLALAGGSTSGLTVIQRVTGRSSVGGFLENSDTSVALSSTLTRYAASITMANASTLRVSSDIVLSYSSGAVIDITLRIGLPQLEQGAFATSVIPTTTAAATRNADVASITGTNFSSWYRQDEGTLFGDAFREFAVPAGQFPVIVDCRTSGGSPNVNQFSYLLESIAGIYIAVGGAVQSELYPPVPGGTRRRRVASAYAANNFAACVNGLTPLTDSTGSVGNVTSMTIGSVTGSGQYLNGHIRRLVYWGQRLPDNALQAITQ